MNLTLSDFLQNPAFIKSVTQLLGNITPLVLFNKIWINMLIDTIFSRYYAVE